MKALDRFRKLNKRQKAELITASFLTAALLVALPTYAWFAGSKNLETITKIKEPGEIVIRAGKALKTNEADPIVNFEMKDIDIQAIAAGTPKRFVFSVYPGDYNLGYNLQLAHTTNIPFTYTIYRATAPDTTNMTSQQIAALTPYSPIEAPELVTYYQTDGNVDGNADNTSLPMSALNEDDGTAYGRKIAKQDDNGDEYKCYSQTYDGADEPDIYAVPVYMQTDQPVMRVGDPADGDGFDYFILELGWDTTAVTEGSDYADWNIASNNKETDMIYITAKRSTG